MVNIENDSEGPYMQDFFGDVSTIYVLACVIHTGQQKKGLCGWVGRSCLFWFPLLIKKNENISLSILNVMTFLFKPLFKLMTNC